MRSYLQYGLVLAINVQVKSRDERKMKITDDVERGVINVAVAVVMAMHYLY